MYSTIKNQQMFYNPIPLHNPRDWYGQKYHPYIVGINNDRYIALMNCVKGFY